MKLQVERKLDVTVMKFDGRITLGLGSAAYTNAICEMVWDGHKKLALDYSRITYVDSSGIGEMVRAYTVARNAGADLVLFSLTKDTTNRLIITRLFTVFPVYSSLHSALAHFEPSREIQLRERVYGPVSVLEIQGDLSVQHGAARITTAIEASLDARAASLILLFPQVLGIDESGGKLLQDVRKMVRERGGDLVLAGAEPRLEEPIRAAGAEDIPSFSCLDDALNTFGLTVDRQNWRVEAARVR